MRKHILLLFLAALSLCSSAFGVATVSSGSTTYQTTDPFTGTSVWDYVGKINGSSAVYLGDGWVITCGHVLSLSNTAATYSLGGTTYSIAADSIQYVSNGVDLVMFQLSNYSSISLTSLTLATNTTTANAGSSVLMIGYGFPNKSYGYSTVYNYSMSSRTGATTIDAGTSGTYTSIDFVALSTTSELVGGDSGGGAFYKDANGHWVLAGILEATNTATVSGTLNYVSYIVDMATYAPQIETIMTSSVPEPTTVALAGAGLGAIWWLRRRKNRAA